MMWSLPSPTERGALARELVRRGLLARLRRLPRRPCAECRYFRAASASASSCSASPESDDLRYLPALCLNLVYARPIGGAPTAGVTYLYNANSLSRISMVREMLYAYGTCHTYNPDGLCPHFEAAAPTHTAPAHP